MRLMTRLTVCLALTLSVWGCETDSSSGGDAGAAHYHVHVDADPAQVAAALAPLGAQVTPAPRTLEQVFLSLTGHALRDGEPPAEGTP